MVVSVIKRKRLGGFVTLMSRGHGKVQRAILAVLADGKSYDTGDIAAMAFDLEPSEDGTTYINQAQRAAVARALAKMARESLVFRLFRGHNKRAYWANAEGAKRYRERLELLEHRKFLLSL